MLGVGDVVAVRGVELLAPYAHGLDVARDPFEVRLERAARGGRVLAELDGLPVEAGLGVGDRAPQRPVDRLAGLDLGYAHNIGW